jgi:hypothetical protein
MTWEIFQSTYRHPNSLNKLGILMRNRLTLIEVFSYKAFDESLSVDQNDRKNEDMRRSL